MNNLPAGFLYVVIADKAIAIEDTKVRRNNLKFILLLNQQRCFDGIEQNKRQLSLYVEYIYSLAPTDNLTKHFLMFWDKS